jgi:hypothetical protein
MIFLVIETVFGGAKVTIVIQIATDFAAGVYILIGIIANFAAAWENKPTAGAVGSENVL